METLELSFTDYSHGISVIVVRHHWPLHQQVVGLLSLQ